MNKGESNFLKLVAIIAMLLDHIGKFLHPYIAFTIIGRIAFPIFAYQLVIGYRNTSNKKNYVRRLLLFGFISQIPYSLLNEAFFLNIFFTLTLGIIAIWSIEEKKYLYIFILFFLVLFVEYHFYGLFTILIFYFIQNKNLQIVSFSLMSLLFSALFQAPTQIFSTLSFVFFQKPLPQIHLPKYSFYVFYPVHLILIYLIVLYKG